MTAGRPTRYRAELAEEAENYALIGFTDVEIAEALEISLRSLDNWKKKHPEFMQAIKRGKQIADGKVAASLYKRATGFMGPDGKYYPPDTTAGIFWQKNRQKTHWRDKHDVEHSGRVDYSNLTDDEIDRKIAELSKG